MADKKKEKGHKKRREPSPSPDEESSLSQSEEESPRDSTDDSDLETPSGRSACPKGQKQDSRGHFMSINDDHSDCHKCRQVARPDRPCSVGDRCRQCAKFSDKRWNLFIKTEGKRRRNLNRRLTKSAEKRKRRHDSSSPSPSKKKRHRSPSPAPRRRNRSPSTSGRDSASDRSRPGHKHKKHVKQEKSVHRRLDFSKEAKVKHSKKYAKTDVALKKSDLDSFGKGIYAAIDRINRQMLALPQATAMPPPEAPAPRRKHKSQVDKRSSKEAKEKKEKREWRPPGPFGAIPSLQNIPPARPAAASSGSRPQSATGPVIRPAKLSVQYPVPGAPDRTGPADRQTGAPALRDPEAQANISVLDPTAPADTVSRATVQQCLIAATNAVSETVEAPTQNEDELRLNSTGEGVTATVRSEPVTDLVQSATDLSLQDSVMDTSDPILSSVNAVEIDADLSLDLSQQQPLVSDWAVEPAGQFPDHILNTEVTPVRTLVRPGSQPVLRSREHSVDGNLTAPTAPSTSGQQRSSSSDEDSDLSLGHEERLLATSADDEDTDSEGNERRSRQRTRAKSAAPAAPLTPKSSFERTKSMVRTELSDQIPLPSIEVAVAKGALCYRSTKPVRKPGPPLSPFVTELYTELRDTAKASVGAENPSPSALKRGTLLPKADNQVHWYESGDQDGCSARSPVLDASFADHDLTPVQQVYVPAKQFARLEEDARASVLSSSYMDVNMAAARRILDELSPDEMTPGVRDWIGRVGNIMETMSQTIAHQVRSAVTTDVNLRLMRRDAQLHSLNLREPEHRIARNQPFQSDHLFGGNIDSWLGRLMRQRAEAIAEQRADNMNAFVVQRTAPNSRSSSAARPAGQKQHKKKAAEGQTSAKQRRASHLKAIAGKKVELAKKLKLKKKKDFRKGKGKKDKDDQSS